MKAGKDEAQNFLSVFLLPHGLGSQHGMQSEPAAPAYRFDQPVSSSQSATPDVPPSPWIFHPFRQLDVYLQMVSRSARGASGGRIAGTGCVWSRRQPSTNAARARRSGIGSLASCRPVRSCPAAAWAIIPRLGFVDEDKDGVVVGGGALESFDAANGGVEPARLGASGPARLVPPLRRPSSSSSNGIGRR